jgi:hypothetical protein
VESFRSLIYLRKFYFFDLLLKIVKFLRSFGVIGVKVECRDVQEK